MNESSGGGSSPIGNSAVNSSPKIIPLSIQFHGYNSTNIRSTTSNERISIPPAQRTLVVVYSAPIRTAGIWAARITAIMSTTQAAAVVKAIPDQVVKDLPRHAAKVFRNLPGKVAKYNAEGREIQGRRRFIRSNAAKNFIRGESARVASALQSRHHGKNIYAYNHIKTKQVVYSLTRDLQVSIRV